MFASHDQPIRRRRRREQVGRFSSLQLERGELRGEVSGARASAGWRQMTNLRGAANKTMPDEKACISACHRGCTVTRYTIKQTSNHPAIILNSQTHRPMAAPNQTSFFLSWGSMEFMLLEQSYKFESVVAFISKLGNALGVWLVRRAPDDDGQQRDGAIFRASPCSRCCRAAPILRRMSARKS